MNDGIYTAQQQVITPQLVQEIIGVILVVVMVMWGFRQFGRTVRGEPIEQIPI
jgi:flagellar biogenesis protein FliO